MSAGPATLKNIQRGELTHAGWSQVHTYQVFTTDGTDGPDVVLGASGLPSFGSGLAYDPLARVSRISPIKQEDATNHWQVEVEYSRETGNQQDFQQPPTLRPVKRSASIRWVEMALMKDIHGNPILTAAKSPFNPPITISMPHPVVRFQRWEEEFTTATIRNYAGKVNSEFFGVYVPGEVLCTNIEASEEWEQDADGEPRRYWLVTYEFEACVGITDMWRPMKILDADYWFIDPDPAAIGYLRKPIFVDANGIYHGDPKNPDGATPVPSPVPLLGHAPGLPDIEPEGFGRVLQASELPDAACYIELDVYEEVDFNELELPVD